MAAGQTQTKKARTVKKAGTPALWTYDDGHRQRLVELGVQSPQLVGIDEVGRGCLMGPVVTAAVCFPMPITFTFQEQLKALNDSKKLTRATRETLSHIIHQEAWVGIGQASPQEIDQLNIHHATLLAFGRAYEKLLQTMVSPDECAAEMMNHFLLVDGKFGLPSVSSQQQQTVVKGDGTSAVIAAASVVAKVYRDNWVIAQSEHFPGYGWEENMGYGTPAHRQGIEALGLTEHHRLRFCRNLQGKQLALF